MSKRYPKDRLKHVDHILALRSQPQIREVEAFVLYITRKHAIADQLPVEFVGRTEA